MYILTYRVILKHIESITHANMHFIFIKIQKKYIQYGTKHVVTCCFM